MGGNSFIQGKSEMQKTNLTKPRTIDTCALISFLVLAQCVPFLQLQPALAVENVQPPSTSNSGSVDPSGGLNIAAGTTRVLDVSDSSALHISGNLNNQGVLYVISTNPLVHTATLAAQNIFNGPGATITTVLPTGGLAAYSTAITNLSLSLVAVNDIINHGTIASANNLTAIAGGSILNVTQLGSTTAVMQATNNLSVLASSITNSGTLAAINGNINLANPSLYTAALASIQQSMSTNLATVLQNNISINNTGGLIQALNGTVNIGGSELAKNTVLSLVGGNIASPVLNIDGGSGSIQGSLDNISGIVNMKGCSAQLGTQSGTLNLGSITITDDPTFYNNGDITINGDIIVGETLAFLATGNITSVGTAKIQSNPGGIGNDITFIAGGNFIPFGAPVGGTTPPGNALVPGQFVALNGGSGSGGSINLNGATVNASSTIGNNAGGNVTMVAYGGLGTGGIQNANIITGGSGTGANGNVTLCAGGTIGLGNTAIDNVRVQITGANSFVPGNVQFFAAAPLAFGFFTSTGGFSGVLPFTLTTRDINVSASIQTDGGKVGMKSAGTITVLNTINTGSVAAGKNAGDITIEGKSLQVLNSLLAIGQVGALGTTGGAGGAGGNGGMISLTGTDAITINANIDASGGNGGKGGDGALGLAQLAGGAGGGGGMGGSAGGLSFKTMDGFITQTTLSTIKSTGGNGGNGGNGGQGGAAGASTAGAGGMGGGGGTASGGATFLADSGKGNMMFQGVINLQGGNGANGGNGGDGGSDPGKMVFGGAGGSTGTSSGGALGGTINLTTSSGNITLSAISGFDNLNGGSGGLSGSSGAGGDGSLAGTGGFVQGSGGGGGGGTMVVTSTSGGVTFSGFGLQLKGGDGGVMANNSGKGGNGASFGGSGGTLFGAGGGGDGGKLTVTTAGDILSVANIDASGGAGGAVTSTAGDGGSGSVLAGSGGSLGASGGGGLGGGISLTSSSKGVSVGGLLSTLSTSGGAGGLISGIAGKGGAGLTASGSGGNGGGIGGGGGGAIGGRIALSAKTGILVTAQLNTLGGAGGSITGTAGAGGSGGSSAQAGMGGAILSAGGGASGGTIDIRTEKGAVSLAGINANGGNGGDMTATTGAGGDGSAGGTGGRAGDSGGGGGGGGISISTSQMAADGGAVTVNLAPVQASGGVAGLYTAKSGNGGKGLSFAGGDGGAIGNQNSAGGGGQIFVTGLSLSVGALLNQSSIKADGGHTSVNPRAVATYVGYAPQSGDGGNAGGSSRGGNGGGIGMAGSGGMGGSISINMPGTITLLSDINGGDVISARGGIVADNRAVSGKGGTGGPVSGFLSSGGGNGGDIGKNGNGGNGGKISIVGGAGDMGGIAVVVASGGSVGVPDFLFPGVRGMEAVSGAGGDAGPSGAGGKSGDISSNGSAGNGGFIFVSSTSGGIDISNFIMTGGDINAIYRPQTGSGGKGGTNNFAGGSGGKSGVIGDNGTAGNGGLFFALTNSGKFGPPAVTPLKLTNVLAAGGAVIGSAAMTGNGGNSTSSNAGGSGLIGNNGVGGNGGAIFILSTTGDIATAKGSFLLSGGDGGFNLSKTGNGGTTGGGIGGSSGNIGNNGKAGNAGLLFLLTGGDIKLGGSTILEGGATSGNLAQTGNGGKSTSSTGGSSGTIGYGGNSGNGGTALILAGKSFASSELVNLNGGNSVKGLYAPRTGNGGDGLTFGGSSGVIEGQGKGGDAGSVLLFTLTPLTGDIAPDRFTANGGSAGGTVILPNGGGTVTFDGKMSAMTGNGGNGGQTGGDAGKIDDASAGGKGGTIYLNSAAKLINAAQFTSNGGNGAQQASIGGNGGTGTLAGGGAGGAVGASGGGGDSNTINGITLTSKLGPVQLKSIEAFGGNGGVNSGVAGNGGNGGLAGGAGGDLGISGGGGAGGAVSLTFGGDTLIESNTLGADPIKMYGGNGGDITGSAGNGGNGTTSPVIGPPAGTTGGVGGKGGSLFGISGGGGVGGSISANITGILTVVQNTNLSGGDTGLYSATAGNGGTGSAGTLPNSAQAGGKGGATGDQGKGGNGGKIGPTFTVGSLVNNSGFSFLANGGSALAYSAKAGSGGVGGGDGGAGGSTGAPGAAGRGGEIAISSSGNIMIDGSISVNGGSRDPVTAIAGNGANAGLAGGGGGDAGSITGTGDAGTAGKITLKSQIGNVTGMGTLTANGGNIIMGATQVQSGTGGDGLGVGTGGIGGNVDRQGDGGTGGAITVFANGFINLPFYVANGGTATASFAPTVGSGGSGTNNGVRIGVGGQAGSIIGKATSGGGGGSVELRSFLGDITPTQITAVGGSALDFAGIAGNGGNQTAGVSGNGGNGGKTSDNGNGGVGGTVTITTFGKVDVAQDLNISGGNVGGYSGKGGNGGQNFGVSGNGGNGGDTGSNGSGGKGGTLTITSFDGQIRLRGSVLADGGSQLGDFTGVGGKGGNAPSVGGGGGTAGSNGASGEGGNLFLFTFGSGAIVVDPLKKLSFNAGVTSIQSGKGGDAGTNSLDLLGNAGGQGGTVASASTGGNGGNIFIYSTNGAITLGGNVLANGATGGLLLNGTAGKGGDGAPKAGGGGTVAGAGKGGNGGLILLTTLGGVLTTSGVVQANGGFGGSQLGVAGAGGKGTVDGGKGGDAADAGNGGNGGFIFRLAGSGTVGATPSANFGLGGAYLGTVGKGGAPNGMNGIPGKNGVAGMPGFVSYAVDETDQNGLPSEGRYKRRIALRRTAETRFNENGAPYLSAGIDYNAADTPAPSGLSDLRYADYVQVPEQIDEANKPVSLVEVVPAQMSAAAAKAMYAELEGSTSAVVCETTCNRELISRVTAFGADLRSGGSEADFQLKRGELLFAPAAKQITVSLPDGKLKISGGSKVLVEVTDGRTIVRTLHDRKLGDVVFLSENSILPVNIGHQLVITNGDAQSIDSSGTRQPIAIRKTTTRHLPSGITLSASEFSLVSAISRNPILKTLSRSQSKADKKHMEQILKSTCIVSFLTVKHGPFQQ